MHESLKGNGQSCGNCFFWLTDGYDNKKEDKKNDIPQGCCHRYPPRFDSEETEIHHRNGLWYGVPSTYENEWCGEWKGETEKAVIDAVNKQVIEVPDTRDIDWYFNEMSNKIKNGLTAKCPHCKKVYKKKMDDMTMRMFPNAKYDLMMLKTFSDVIVSLINGKVLK